MLAFRARLAPTARVTRPFHVIPRPFPTATATATATSTSACCWCSTLATATRPFTGLAQATSPSTSPATRWRESPYGLSHDVSSRVDVRSFSSAVSQARARDFRTKKSRGHDKQANHKPQHSTRHNDINANHTHTATKTSTQTATSSTSTPASALASASASASASPSPSPSASTPSLFSLLSHSDWWSHNASYLVLHCIMSSPLFIATYQQQHPRVGHPSSSSSSDPAISAFLELWSTWLNPRTATVTIPTQHPIVIQTSQLLETYRQQHPQNTPPSQSQSQPQPGRKQTRNKTDMDLPHDLLATVVSEFAQFVELTQDQNIAPPPPLTTSTSKPASPSTSTSTPEKGHSTAANVVQPSPVTSPTTPVSSTSTSSSSSSSGVATVSPPPPSPPTRTSRRHRLRELHNLCSPHLWYPLARSIRRHIIIHCGPTNSGKTWQALQRMKQAPSGVYAGPLRLLAWEVHDKITSQGVPCELLTGQERIYIPGAKHISCTVETVNVDKFYSVAVIDECQLIASSDRGHSWTRALLGVAAKEIHVCGDPSMVELVETLCKITGDICEVRHYTRLSPLRTLPPLRNGFSQLERGDAVIAFSRKDLYEIKREIEGRRGFKCAIVYGSLPPEIRKMQAESFNDPNSGYDILVASDAVGLGLNLSIRRVVFSSVSKFDGEEFRTLKATELKQIAGRAGRFGTSFECGYVTSLKREDQQVINTLLEEGLQPIKQAGLAPPFSVYAAILAERSDLTLLDVLRRFGDHAELDQHFFLVDMSQTLQVAEQIKHVPLSLEAQFEFCLAPARVDNAYVMAYVIHLAEQFSSSEAGLEIGLSFDADTVATDPYKISKAERVYSCLDVYLHLALRFPTRFPFYQQATAMQENVAAVIESGLETLSEEQQARMRARLRARSRGGRGRSRSAAMKHVLEEHERNQHDGEDEDGTDGDGDVNDSYYIKPNHNNNNNNNQQRHYNHHRRDHNSQSRARSRSR